MKNKLTVLMFISVFGIFLYFIFKKKSDDKKQKKEKSTDAILTMTQQPIINTNDSNNYGVVEEELFAQAPIIFDRPIPVSTRSRLSEGSDPIRGDLPIEPNQTNGWFGSDAKPHLDLRRGVLDSSSVNTAHKLEELMAFSAAKQSALDSQDTYQASSFSNKGPSYQTTNETTTC